MSNYPRPGSGSMEADYARALALDAKLTAVVEALDELEPHYVGHRLLTDIQSLAQRVREERARIVGRYD